MRQLDQARRRKTERRRYVRLVRNGVTGAAYCVGERFTFGLLIGEILVGKRRNSGDLHGDEASPGSAMAGIAG